VSQSEEPVTQGSPTLSNVDAMSAPTSWASSLVSSGNEEEMEEPARRVKKREQKKARMAAQSVSHGSSQTVTQKSQSKICSHFLRGVCRHGFYGRTPRDGKPQCSYEHPDMCKKLLGQGTGLGGCQKGKECKSLHLKMCGTSLETRKCPNLGRCPHGYHVRETVVEVVPASVKKVPRVKNPTAAAAAKNPTSTPVLIKGADALGCDTATQLRSFFGEVIQEEISRMLLGTRQVPPWNQVPVNLPVPVPEVVPQPPMSQARGMDGLSVLLGLLGGVQKP
jgi:hypothetical protein